ncbi:MAG: sulfatase [Candidatus Coatesbacteria bacterium]|nr:MAG: sulfatase [Candidatus Coatesbacteria bacterium]
MRRTMVFAAAFAVSVLAIGFFWGAAEALLNYYRPVVGTPRAFYLLESINDRAFFYTIITLLVFVFGTAGSFVAQFSSKKNIGSGHILAFPVLLGTTAAVSVNLFWLALSFKQIFHGINVFSSIALNRAAWDLILFSTLFNVFGLLLVFVFVKTRTRRFTKPITYSVSAAGAALLIILQGTAVYKSASRPVPSHLPDVYVISVDACRADYFDGETAPRLTKYARKNCVIFENARSPTSWTTPSFASMFTGQYPDSCTRGGFTLVREVPTLAEILYRNGYDTYLLTGNPVMRPARGLPRGFRFFFYWEMSPLLHKTRFYETGLVYYITRGYNIKTGPGVINEAISERAYDVIEKDGKRPRFVWVHYLDPHSPYYPSPKYISDEYKKYAENPEFCLSDDVYKPENVPALKELYRGEVRMLDDEIPPLIDLIESTGDPIIIFTSDHGEEFYDHGNFRHGKTAYEEVMRVPLFIKLPSGTPRGGPRIGKRNVNAASIAPTILELLGLHVPATVQVGSLFDNPDDAPDITFYGSLMHTGGRTYAAVEGDMKFIARKSELEAGGEYYDLPADPGELNPLPFNETSERLRRALIEWVETNSVVLEAQESGESEVISKDDFRALGYVK